MKGTQPKTERNKKIVRLKEKDKKNTFKKLAKDFGLSETRVKQIYYRDKDKYSR